jgi:hypothetical protein
MLRLWWKGLKRLLPCYKTWDKLCCKLGAVVRHDTLCLLGDAVPSKTTQISHKLQDHSQSAAPVRQKGVKMRQYAALFNDGRIHLY